MDRHHEWSCESPKAAPQRNFFRDSQIQADHLSLMFHKTHHGLANGLADIHISLRVAVIVTV